MPIFASSGNPQFAAPVSYVHISPNLRDPGAVIFQVLPSPESSDEPCGRILQFAPIWYQDLSQERHALSSTQRIPNTDQTSQRSSKPDGAAPGTMSTLSFSVKAKKCDIDLFALFQCIVNGFFTQRTELLFECVVRDDVVLIFHPLNNHCAENETHAAIRNPVVFLSHSVNVANYLLNAGGFPRPFMSTGLWRTFCRGCALVVAV